MEVLTQKQYRQYGKLSRYNHLPYYYHNLDNKYIYGTGSNLRDDTTFTLYEIKKFDTLDSIALRFYNNPTYYWIIADYNRIQDPYVKLVPGNTLKVPNLSTINFITYD